MSLQNEQAEFIEALTSDMMLDTIVPSSHLVIHQNNIRTNLTETLKATYPLLIKLLGEDFFVMAAHQYINQYPSRSGNLHEYGNYFGDFLEQFKPAQSLIYLSEVAEFEWLCHTLYLAADHPPFVTQALENYNHNQFNQLHFILHPALALKRFKFPILDIVDLCKEDPEKTVDLDKGGVNLLIIRRNLDLSLLSLSQADYYFLEALNQNCSLHDALELAQTVEPDYPLSEKLPKFIKKKIVVDCYLNLDD